MRPGTLYSNNKMEEQQGDPQSNPTTESRFKPQNVTAEDLLKSQTVGLVKLEDFRKRRAEVLEQQAEPELPRKDTTQQSKKKPRKVSAKPLLSFDLEEGSISDNSTMSISANSGPDATTTTADVPVPLKRPRPNTGTRPAPKNMTKSALTREARMKEELRKEYLAVQEIVKATEVMMPFVFYEGVNKSGGVIKMKKGEQISLFLERARKAGIRSGHNNGEKRDNTRKGWARMSTDELMLVRGDMIIPHVGRLLLSLDSMPKIYLITRSTLTSITLSSTSRKAFMVLSSIFPPSLPQPLLRAN